MSIVPQPQHEGKRPPCESAPFDDAPPQTTIDGYRGVYHRARIRATRWFHPFYGLTAYVISFTTTKPKGRVFAQRAGAEGQDGRC
jgi:hypothetical protein